jgi:hypothetical protein
MVTQANPNEHPKIVNLVKKNASVKEDLAVLMEQVRQGQETFAQSEGLVDATGESLGDLLIDRIHPVALVVKDTTSFFIGHTKPVNVVNTIHIANKHFLFPRHFFIGGDGKLVQSDEQKKYELHIQVKGVLYIVEFEPQRLKCLRGRDGEWLEVCLYDFGGNTLPQQRDCYSFFS